MISERAGRVRSGSPVATGPDMWLVTTQGFYSAVAHRNHRRLRDRPRAQPPRPRALRRQIPEIEPFEDPSADYRHRALVSRSEWVAAVAQLASAIDYDNSKSAVAERQGPKRARVYGRVWGELLELQSAGAEE